MSTDKSNRVDIIADSIDELKTIADELQDAMTTPEESDTLARLRRALDEASEAADRLENLDKG